MAPGKAFFYGQLSGAVEPLAAVLGAWDENRRCVYIGDLPGKRFDPAKPMVALTFDDGPYKGRTERIVDALTEVDGRATFFVLGASVANEPDTLRYTALRGNEIGNHSYSHPKMTTLSLASLNTELEQTDQVVAAITGEAPTLIRPTYGCFNPNLQGCVSHPLVMWNIDPQDWLTKDAKATVDHVMAEVKDGDIVVMHDIHEPSVEATISLVKKLDEAGYQLVTVSEMMAAKGVEMTPGRVISHG